MGSKFTAEDLFRIAEDNLSDVERVEFIFNCEVSAFRKATSRLFGQQVGIDADEQRLLEKIFAKFSKGGIRFGGR